MKIGDKIRVVAASSYTCFDYTIGKEYTIVKLEPDTVNYPDAVYVIDDVGETNILFCDEYEVLK